MTGPQRERGAQPVARHIGLELALKDVDRLITGKGHSDTETLRGPPPFLAAQYASAAGVPASVLSGAIDTSAFAYLGEGFAGCFSPAPGPITLDIAIGDVVTLLENAAEQMARLRYSMR
nr:glycerate kinase [Paraburkholderia panacisoli]